LPVKSDSLPPPQAEEELVTVKLTPLLATPPTVTITFPAVAPFGTGATIVVELQLVGVATVPLNVTVLVPCVEPKFAPAIVTEVPTGPEFGVRLAMPGVEAELTIKSLNMAALADCGPAALESITVTEKVLVPAEVGEPERTPAELSDRPAASPVPDQFRVPEPPEAEKVKEYCCPTVAGEAVTCAWVVVTAGSALTVTVTLALTLVSFTDVAVTMAVPVAPFALKVTE
jgi:hypothetical protein